METTDGGRGDAPKAAIDHSAAVYVTTDTSRSTQNPIARAMITHTKVNGVVG
jgi:hypothetical protein